MKLGEETAVHSALSVLALDGEREVEIAPGDRTAIRLVKDGPIVVSVK